MLKNWSKSELESIRYMTLLSILRRYYQSKAQKYTKANFDRSRLK